MRRSLALLTPRISVISYRGKGRQTVTQFCPLQRPECERGAYPSDGNADSHAVSPAKTSRVRAWRPSERREGRQSRSFASQSAQNASVAPIQATGRQTVTQFRELKRPKCERGARPSDRKVDSHAVSPPKASRVRAGRPSKRREGRQSRIFAS